MEILTCRPEGDRTEKSLSGIGASFIAAAGARSNVRVTDLCGPANATRAATKRELKNADLFAYFGHGLPNALGAQPAIVTASDAWQFKDKHVAAIACLAGDSLGKDMVRTHGAQSFLGFDDLLVVVPAAGSVMGQPVVDALMVQSGPTGTAGAALSVMQREYRLVRDRFLTGAKRRSSNATLIWMAAHANARTCIAYDAPAPKATTAGSTAPRGAAATAVAATPTEITYEDTEVRIGDHTLPIRPD